jgi:outer membrane protein TolC
MGVSWALGLALLPGLAPGQGLAPDAGRPLAAVIDEYVREGLEANLSLRGQSLEVERSAAALDEARARYFPEVGLDARYTWAQGGRTFELPLGQALNPAY